MAAWIARPSLARHKGSVDPVRQVRAAIARWRATFAQRFVDRARGCEPAPVAWPREPLALLAAAGAMLPGEAPAAAAHLARAAAERRLEPAREKLDEWRAGSLAVGRDRLPLRDALAELRLGQSARGPALLRGIEASLAAPLPAVLEAHRAAARAATRLWAELGQPPHADAGPEAAERRATAQAWLTDTDGVVADLVDAADLPGLLRRLRWPAGDRGFRSAQRFRKAGARWAPLGLERELARAVQVEPPHREGHPGARVWVVAPGRDVRIVPSDLELGWQSELAAARAVGRALARALVGPLPAPLQYASVGSTARALGDLGAQVFAEPRPLREEGLGRRDAEEVRRRVGLWLLLETRWCCASILAPPVVAGPEEQRALAAEAARRALGVPVPPWVATLGLLPSAAPRLRALLGALRLWGALRERWDEDWYRNPRASEALREACERGGAYSVEAWCADLGAARPLPRLLELL